MDIRGTRTLRASLLALAATAAALLGTTRSASADQFNFSPTGTGVGVSTSGLQFAGGNALVTVPGGTAIPLTNGEQFTLLFQTHLNGLAGVSNQAFAAAIGAGQVTEVAILHETVTITGAGSASFSLTPGAQNQISIYANPTSVYNDATGTGFATGTMIATLVPTSTTGLYNSTFNVLPGTQMFNQTGAGEDAGNSGVTAINGSGNANLSMTPVMSTNPLYFNPPTGIPALKTSTLGIGNLSAVFDSINPSTLFTNPINNAITYVPAIGTVNGQTGPDLQLQVSGFTQSFQVVPEPTSMTLMGLGVVGALVVVRRTRARVA